MSDTSGQVLSVSNKQGTKREYETILILRPQTSKVGIREFVTKMQGVFEKCGARLIKIENWGTRTLAYPINRSPTGIYLYWRYLGGSDIVHEFERNLRITDAVLRFYTVKVDEDVDPAARPSEITDDLLENISEPPPEPEPEPVREVEEENSMYADDGVEGLEEGVN
ncbi:MAG: 30S ribosomal protein S6 [Nannocystis sp.]|uniref:30S ribosomal protein S6 n=1 Tax=Nannocystis sp. TaxID=1962667 RepID=UPI0024210C12|nr:30S ribosomal protein S6 [Nannocystis sp.]MBK9752629.1 30S ribosomal protein S6 [Nannocystis sp.]